MKKRASKQAEYRRTGKRAQARRRTPGAPASTRAGHSDAARLGALLLTGTFAVAHVPVYAGGGALPVPCPGSGAACIGATGKALGFNQLGTPSVLSNPNANTLQIQQNANSAIFNWASFNISPGNTVNFVQPSSSSVALNRIFDPNVSSINGNLKANGQIYLINPNGILFGSHANVNVAGLIASTSNMTDARVTAGLLSDLSQTDPVFTNNAGILGNSAAESPVASANATPSIVVQSGATLYAAGKDTSGSVVSAGRVFLFAPTVENGGSITVDGGGQVILAAGSDVYLGSSSNAALRGLLVEVTGNTSSVTIDATGNVSVPRGNITLMGLAVNQGGSLGATTALDANGSILLLAREASTTAGQGATGVAVSSGGDPDVLLVPGQTGTVNLASGSKTVITVDPTDTATAPLSDPTAAALNSTITISAGAVNIGGSGAPGSTLLQAHGGDITVTARTPQSQVDAQPVSVYALGDGSLLGASNLNAAGGQGNIDVGADANIDVSGLQHVAVDGSRNFVYIPRLTSTNLADAPYQRSGFLLGQGAYVNLNNVPSWLNVASLQQAVAGTQAERDSVGGTIALRAEGTVSLAKGSTLNVSGGSTDVTAAQGRVSQLITSNGSVVALNANASADTQFTGFVDQGGYTAVDTREGVNATVAWQSPSLSQQGGYTLGANAGTVQIYASAASLIGSLQGQTISSPSQRNAPPLGGLLQINGISPALLDSEAGIQRPNILLAGSADQLAQGLAPNLAASTSGPTIELNTTTLAQAGFNRYSLTSDGAIELAAGTPLNLGAGGQFAARANAIAINASISAPGGSITLAERPLSTLPAGDGAATDETSQRNVLSLVPVTSALRGAIDLQAGTTLSTAGLWTNDLTDSSATPATPVVLTGGAISIAGSSVNVSGSSFDVSAGGWLNQSGQFSGGAGGSLALAALPSAPAIAAAPTAPQLDLGSDFASRIAGFGVSKGGTLSLSAWSVQLGSGVSSDPSTIDIDPAVGSRGFQSFQFGGYQQATVAAGTQFVPQPAFLQYAPTLAAQASAASLLAIDAPVAPLPGVAAPASISLKASNPLGSLVQVGQGAVLDAGIEGSIALTGSDTVLVDGTLRARAGSVALTLANADQTGTSSPFTLATLQSRSIQLGSTADIDVSGASLVTQQASGLRTGSVLDAGSVALVAPLGSIAVDAGSRIQANGASDTVDILGNGAQYAVQLVGSAGGKASFAAGNALYVEGQIQAAGTQGANGGDLSVALQATAPNPGDSDPAVAAQLALPTNLTVTASLPALSAHQASFPVAGGLGAQGAVAPATINGSGFEQVWLQSADTITLAQSMNLGGRTAGPHPAYSLNTLVLSAQGIDLAPGASVALTAGNVVLGPAAQLNAATGGYSNFQSTPPAGSAGTGALQVNAQQIDLVGNLALQDVGQASLSASADIVGLGIQNGNNPTRFTGGLSFGGNLSLAAAQIYPATQTDYTFSFAPAGSAADAGNGQLQVAVDAQSTAALVPLSAGGSLTFDVNTFASSGRVEAPQGSIAINANSITLAPGSLLSITGAGLVPYGEVYNGTSWTYAVPPGNSVAIDPYTIASTTGTALPSKGVTLNSPNGTVSAQAGATISVAGGGDVLGSGFLAGPGGLYDMSLNFPYGNGSRNPFFALVPSRGSATAAYDPQTYADLVLDPALPSSGTAGFVIGQTITIAGGAGIAAGTYTILPPRYALLPGAYAVEAVPGYAGIAPGNAQVLADGTAVVAGKLGYPDAGTQASLWSPFRVYTDAQFRTLSQFVDYYGSTYFAAAAADAGQVAQRLGQDAGSLQVDGQAVLLAAAIAAAPSVSASGATGRGAEIAIDAPSIVVGDFAAPATAPQSALQLDAASLSRLGAETLILGANDTGSGATVTLGSPVPTQSVTLQSTAPLSAGQVVLVGASVSVQSGASVVAAATQAPPTQTVQLGGDGAGLYVGNVAAPPAWSRTGASAPGSATQGNLTIAAGATIQGESALFDATATQTYDPGLQLHVASLGLSSSVVNVGNVPAGTGGLNLSSDLLGALASAHDLTITSLGGIDVYGSATIGQTGATGAPTIDRLTIVGPGFSGFGAASDSLSLTAGHVTLDNTAGATTANAGTGSGTLAIHAAATSIDDGSIDVAGSLGFSGFSAIGLAAVGRAGSAAQTVQRTGDLLFQGAVGATPGLVVTGSAASLSIDATRITAQRGVDASISVPGALAIAASGPAAAAEQAELGASLTVAAQNVDISGRIDLPAGIVAIHATGPASSDGITLDSGASIRVAGVTQKFASTTADVSAGAIELDAANGSINQASGATLDLSGAGTQGDSGTLVLGATNGTVALQGSLLATPGASASGAHFSVDAGTVGNLSALASAFTAAAGAGGAQSISIRARGGDLAVQASDVLKAASIQLEADGAGGAGDGSIQVAGTLDASAASGGSIGLYANDQVVLQPGAQLNAGATSATGHGGAVIISSRVVADPATTLDAIVLQAGSSINVGGGSAGDGGTVILRAPRVGNDVAITAAPGTVSGALGTVAGAPGAANLASTGIDEEVIQAVQVYAQTGNVTLDPSASAGVLATAQTDAQTYMAAALGGGINAARLGLTGYSLRAGIEIDTPGSITVASSNPGVASVLDFAATDPNSGAYLWRYGGSTLATSTPGALTLRAGAGINVQASISDGFNATAPGSKSLSGAVATSGDSWSYVLTAGADLAAANPNRTVAYAGPSGADLVIGTAAATKPVTVRSGTGSIALNASEDVVLNNGAAQQGNVVYTAGVANVLAVDGSGNPLSFPVLSDYVGNAKQTVNVALTQFGGNLTIDAGRDVLGTAQSGANQDGSTQNVNEWLLRGGLATTAAPTVWFVDFANFQQGFGALGGGNLTLDAGRDVTRVGAVVASDGYDSGTGLTQIDTGSLNVNAAGTVLQGLYYNQGGSFQLRASNFAANPNSVDDGVIRLAQGGNVLTVQARQSAYLDTSFNPTLSSPGLINIGNSPSKSKDAAASWQTQFLTYTDGTALDVRVAGGSLTVGTFDSLNAAGLSTQNLQNFYVTAPKLQLVSFGGSVTGDFSTVYGEPVPDAVSGITTAPSATGDVRILADGSIGQLSVVMSQADPAVVPQPGSTSGLSNVLYGSLATDYKGNAGASLHAADPTSAEIVARNGNIGESYLNLVKTTEVAAGGRIGGDLAVPTLIYLQNSNADSLSSISAGQTISFVNGNQFEGLSIDGPGAMQVVAGGGINLGTAGIGIVSRGNLDNSNLNPVGASLLVVAGAGRGADGFAAAPSYAGLIDNFIQYDAFASTGAAASGLNQQVVSALAADPSLKTLVAALQAGLQDRAASVSNAVSTFHADLALLTPAQLAVGAVRLAAAIQVVNNQLFVQSQNRETFAPAYMAFGDLFPSLYNNTNAVDQFVLHDVFAGANNASSLQAQALVGLPAALASAIQLGLAHPQQVGVAGSAYTQALAALDPAVLAAGARQLMANVLSVAGKSEIALAAAGQLTGTGSPYAKSLTAFAQAYAPAAPTGLNDLQMDYSELKVEQTGALAFFAPQGAVIVGQSSPPSFTASKSPSQLGIFTYGGGDIIGMARDSVDVYQSRVFTVAGGDIDLWSSLADLDAGRGPRDVAVVPPPTLVIDSNGVEQLDLSAIVTGSGIGALVTEPNQPASNINLMAPAGYVDAGEAGIRAQSGSVTLGTNFVINGGNISAASGVSGGAVVAAPPPPPPPSTGTSAGDRVVEEAQREALQQQQAAAVAASQRHMRLVGEFIGFDDCEDSSKDGNGNCPPRKDEDRGTRVN